MLSMRCPVDKELIGGGSQCNDLKQKLAIALQGYIPLGKSRGLAEVPTWDLKCSFADVVSWIG